jgi:hypothetical protein
MCNEMPVAIDLIVRSLRDIEPVRQAILEAITAYLHAPYDPMSDFDDRFGSMGTPDLEFHVEILRYRDKSGHRTINGMQAFNMVCRHLIWYVGI